MDYPRKKNVNCVSFGCGRMSTDGKCLFLIGFGAWQVTKDYVITYTLPNQSGSGMHCSGKVPDRSLSTESSLIFLNCKYYLSSKEKRKKNWLSIYAIKFSSSNILIRVPGNSAVQGVQLRKNTCFPPRRQSAWELKQFVSVHQALTPRNSNKWIFCCWLYYPWR